MKQSSAGPMMLIIDAKKGPNVLGIKNLTQYPVGFQIQVYGETGFAIRPDKGLLQAKACMDVEMAGGRGELQSFHVVALTWPRGYTVFDTETWRKIERKDRDKEQVISFGRPPQYVGIKNTGTGGEGGSEGSAKEGEKNSGPAYIQAHLGTISFKPPTGKVQTVVVKLKNVTTKPTAFKVLVNKGPFYSARPGKGMIDVKKDTKIEIEMNASYVQKDFDADNTGHEVHLIAIKWPKPIEDWHPDEWNRLEKARKDQRQRIVLNINHQGKYNEPPDGEAKSSEELCKGPTLIDVVPRTILLSPNLAKTHTLTLKNTRFASTVAFKVQTNKPNFYVVNPCKGLIKAGNRKEVKVEINENLTVKDFQDAEHHQFLMIAVEWTGEENVFDQEEFTAKQKTHKNEVQRLCIDVELEVATKHTYVTAFPSKLSYMPPSGSQQFNTITLVNKSSKATAFKIEAGHPIMNKYFSVKPDSGVVQPTFGAQIKFCLLEGANANELPKETESLSFKVTAVNWALPNFDANVWKEYQGFKKAEMQLMRLKIDFNATSEQSSTDMGGGGGGGNGDPQVMAMLMQQMNQMNQMAFK